MSTQDDALYAQAQQLFDQGDRAGAQRIATQLQSRGYRPNMTAPSASGTVRHSPASVAAPAAAQAPASNADVPDVIRNGGDQAVSEYRNAQRLRAAGNTAQSELAAARAMGHARAQQLLGTISGGRGEAALLSMVPSGVSNFFGRLTKPQGMSDAAFNEYSRTLHSALETSRPVSSIGGIVLQSAAVPELGAERLAASLGGRLATRVAARVGENAAVGGALGAVNADSADQAGTGAVLGAAGGEAGRVLGHGVSFLVRRFMPGRSTAAYSAISRALDDQQIQPAELQAAEARFRTATGRAPSIVEILRDPALGERGQRALGAIQGIARGNVQATARMQITEANATRAASDARAAGNETPHTRDTMNANMGAIRGTAIPANDAANIIGHEDLATVIRPSQGDEGMLPSQINRFHNASAVAHAQQMLADAQKLTTPNAAQVVASATAALRRAEAQYAANPVTINEIDAVRQRLINRAAGTGGAHAYNALGQQVRAIGDQATGGAYGQALDTFGSMADAERAALSRGLEATREATPGATFEQGGTASHAAAAAGHAARGGVVGAAYHATSALRGLSRGVNPAEARGLAAAATERGGVNDFASRLETGRQVAAGERPTTAARVGTTVSRVSAIATNPKDNAAQSPTNDELYQQAQQLFDSGDRAGAQRIVDQLKADNYVPEQSNNTAELTSMPVANDAAETMIRNREGFRANVYNDAGGHPTIGYGHLIRPGEDFSNGISESDAQALMRRDIAETSAPLGDLTVPVDEDQKHALVSFGYNAGPAALRRVVETINRSGLRAGAQVMSRYTTSNGKHVSALAARRQAEIRALVPSSGV